MVRKFVEIDALEAESQFSNVLDRVEKGEEIVITRKGIGIAKLVPLERVPTVRERQAAIERISRLADSHALNGISWKELRDSGRKF